MKILIIDRDSLASQLLTSKLTAKGYDAISEPNKNTAFEILQDGDVDIACVDPAPLPEARPVIIGLWKAMAGIALPYLMVLSKTLTTEEAILAGANDVLNKPLSSQAMETKVQNAARLLEIQRHLRVEEDVHSGGGLIGKAAFHQLFLSANDRAFRYGETSMIVFVSVTNYKEMAEKLGEEAFEKLVEDFTSQMTFMRRQSDVIGRIGVYDFGILLQRPQYETEPMDALNRFAETLNKFRDKLDLDILPEIHLRLIDLPQGALHGERFVPAVGSMVVGDA